VLSGVHSLGGIPDAAMIEYRVRPSRLFDAISYRGVPDIRLLIFRGIPAMAMIRLPTRASDGKANLHQGAVGVGISLAPGCTGIGASSRPASSMSTRTSAARCAATPSRLGAAAGHRRAMRGPDRARLLRRRSGAGREPGPMMLEVNARPGLAIQIANQKRQMRLAAVLDPAVDHLRRGQAAGAVAWWSMQMAPPRPLTLRRR
jgi:hypothetical protein